MKKLEKKLRVGILGGTGMVGQRFITLLESHPWFEVTTIAASSRSAGKTYEEAMSGRWKLEDKMPEAVKNIVVKDVKDIEEISNSVDFVFSAVDMTKEEIKAIEDEYAKSETPVVSNNSAHRWTEDVPMVVPEINIDHFVAESCLSHVTGNEVSRVYNRSNYLNARREAMQKWADYVEQCKKV